METNKIYQGDCLELMKQIEDKSIDLILCDLPYGSTQCSWDVIIPFDKLWEQYKRVIKDKGAIVLTAIQPFSSMLVMSNLEMFKYEWIWVKNRNTNYLNSKHQPLRNSEHILVFYRKIPSFNQIPFSEEEYKYRAEATKNKSGSKNYGSHIIKQDTMVRKPISAKNVLYFDTVHPDSKDYLNHPTQKPVSLFEYLIKTYTNEGDLVLDNCIGSGTTAIACIKTNRRFIGMELEQKYVDIANKRIEEVKQEAMQSEARHSSQP